jgi:hypothetical protein
VTSNMRVILQKKFQLVYSHISINGINKRKTKTRSLYLGTGNIYVSKLLALIGTAFDDEFPVEVEVEVLEGVPASEEIKGKYVTLIHYLEAGKEGLELGSIEVPDIRIDVPCGKVGVLIALDPTEVERNDVRRIKNFLSAIATI